MLLQIIYSKKGWNFIQSSIKIYEHLNKKCNVKIISKKKKSSYYEHNKNIMEMDQMHLGE